MYTRSQSCGWSWDLSSDVLSPLHTPSLITSIQDSEFRITGQLGRCGVEQEFQFRSPAVPETCLETKQITVV